MWRLAGGERSTRFEPASQYSQLPLQVEQSRKTEGSQGARCGPQGKHLAGAGTGFLLWHLQTFPCVFLSVPGTGEEKTVFGRQTTHQEAGQATDSGA